MRLKAFAMAGCAAVTLALSVVSFPLILDRKVHLDVAIATVTRGSRMLKNPNGGFARIIHMLLTTKNPTGLTKTWRNQLME